MTRLLRTRALRNPLALGVGAFAALVALEVATEEDPLTVADLAVDALTYLLVVFSAVGIAQVTTRLAAQEAEKEALLDQLAIARAEGDGWRAKPQAHIAGLQQGMLAQFEAWGLTPAEQEVAMLVPKGLSHRDIATLRDTSEATVRQQAQAVYRKAGLPGKTAFAAYFLEDLFSGAPAADPTPSGIRLVGE